MSPQDIIRAWKDPEYRLSLSRAERGLLPAHPAGLIELADADMVYGEGGWLPGLGQGLDGLLPGLDRGLGGLLPGLGRGVGGSLPGLGRGLSGPEASGTTCLSCTNAVKCC
jgi:mersacidin/lichenicidin family type 2 lantibiotic